MIPTGTLVCWPDATDTTSEGQLVRVGTVTGGDDPVQIQPDDGSDPVSVAAADVRETTPYEAYGSEAPASTTTGAATMKSTLATPPLPVKKAPPARTPPQGGPAPAKAAAPVKRKAMPVMPAKPMPGGPPPIAPAAPTGPTADAPSAPIAKGSPPPVGKTPVKKKAPPAATARRWPFAAPGAPPAVTPGPTADEAPLTIDQVPVGTAVVLPDGTNGVVSAIADPTAADPAVACDTMDQNGSPTGDTVTVPLSQLELASEAADDAGEVNEPAPDGTDAADWEANELVMLEDGVTIGIILNVDLSTSPSDPTITVGILDPTDGTPTGDQVQVPASTLTLVDNGDGSDVNEGEPTGGAQMDVRQDGEWTGPLILEGTPSGDGRQIQANVLTWRELPLPLMVMFGNPEGGDGHAGAELAGAIEWIERRETATTGVTEMWGGGHLDLEGQAGREAARLVAAKMLRGVSADLDNVAVEFENNEPGPDAGLDELMGWDPGTMLIVEGRIMGATLCPFPAFQEAYVQLVGESPDDLNIDVLVASGAECAPCEVMAMVAAAGSVEAQARTWLPYDFSVEALVASAGGAIPVMPPSEWFSLPQKLGEPYPVRVEADGRIHGYVATWDSCHVGYAGRCVAPPRSPSGYRAFTNKSTLCDDGTMMATGPIMMDTVHPDLAMQASDAQSFYGHTGSGVADVALYETRDGIYTAGAARPSATPEQLRALRGSDISPDWRPIKGRLDCIALLAVNTSGFITPALVAAAGAVQAAEGMEGRALAPGVGRARIDVGTGEVTALVAAGMLHHDDAHMHAGDLADLRTELAELRRQVKPLIVASLRNRVALAAVPA